MDRVKPNGEKRLPATNFLLIIPVRFQVSQKLSEKIEFENLIENYSKEKGIKLTTSSVLRKELLDDLKSKNETDLLKKFPAVRDTISRLRNSILLELGLYPNQFSKYIRSKIEKKKEEFNKFLKKEENEV